MPKTTCNLDYYVERLENPELLDNALIAPGGDIAVPVGGKRQGGYVGVDSYQSGRKVIARMKLMPHLYPNPFYEGLKHGVFPMVNFGYDPDWMWWGDRERGEYFGYKDREIERFEKRFAYHDEHGVWLPWEYF